MKKKVMAAFTLAVALILMAGCWSFSSPIDQISSEVPSGWDLWGENYHTKLQDENRNSGMEQVARYDSQYISGYLYYMKYGPACSGEVSDFHTLKEAECFLENRGYDALWAYMEAEEGYSREYEEDVVKMKPLKVIEGYDITFVKLKVDFTDCEDEDGYVDEDYIYIGHVRENIYYIFAENAYMYSDSEDLSIAEQKESIAKLDGEFEEIVSEFMDEGYLDRFIENVGGRAAKDLGSRISNTVLLISLIILLVVVVIVFRKKIPAAVLHHGDKKIQKRTVDGKTTVTVHCTYEDSLKSLLDSGLLTRKEYREMLDKHDRRY